MTLYIGVMSGTSMDSVDAVLVNIEEASLTVVAQHTHDIPESLHQRLSQALLKQSLSALEAWRLDAYLGQLFADAVNALLADQQLHSSRISAIGSHGQTLFHDPENDPALSVQIADPNIIALRTGIVTVSDFRRMDVAAGGQGAPLAPAFHAFSFSHPQRVRGILNIGGIANLTVLPALPNPGLSACAVIGFDTGPGNTLLDLWTAEHQGHAYDESGRWAASGTIIPDLLDDALADAYFSRPPPKSTGREYFNRNWLQQLLDRHPGLAAADVQRTLCELTASSAAQALQSQPDSELFVCGGGALNATLMNALRSQLPSWHIADTGELGIPAKSVEGAAFAWLAHERLHGRSAVPPSITGAQQSVCLGAVYRPPYKAPGN
jgi:anhydro-N-acetylmuramic acid kinase